jgi:ATP-binding cassette subfamily B (MDR/TAP) protein 1
LCPSALTSHAAFSFIFGELVDALNESDSTKLFDEIVRVAIYFLYLGAAAFVVSYMQNCFWMTAGERRIARIRKAYLKAMIRQDMSWFDLNGTDTLSTRISG